ncbi:MAG: LysM peptidoglycan-binding domain-containing protein [Chloroflexota bacterium]
MTAIALLLLWLGGVVPARADSPPATDSLIYTVQPGDVLLGIALRYNLKLADLILANNLTNPNLIFPGQPLVLLGVPAGSSAIPETPVTAADQYHPVQPGETLFGIARQYGVAMGAIMLANKLVKADVIQAGQTLRIPATSPPPPEPQPAPFAGVELSEPTIIQGRTLVVKVTLSHPEATLSGAFEGRPLIFAKNIDGSFWSMVAIHALAPANIHPIILTAARPDGATVTTLENVTVSEGPYGLENIQLDDSRGQLLDATLIQIEQEKLSAIWSQVTPRPLWEGPFAYPVDPAKLRITSYFGTRRSYNGSPAESFHGGTDFGGGVGVPVYAAAAGRVALAESLTVRGQAVLLDHGLGLFSGYWHLNQIVVSGGQEIQPGDLLGYMGSTGLATGPHLHWEIRLQGIAVEPLQWVQQAMP